MSASTAAAVQLRQAEAATDAYEVINTRRTAVEEELTRLLRSYKAGHPEVKLRRSESAALAREMYYLRLAEAAGGPTMTADYGMLLLRKVSAEVELERLLAVYRAGHPEVAAKRDELKTIRDEIEKLSAR